MSLSAHLPVLPIVIPLFAGALAAALGGRGRAMRYLIGVAGSCAHLGASVALYRAVEGGERLVYSLSNWPAPFGIVMVADRLSALMVLLTSVLALVGLLYADANWSRRGRRFQAFWQLQVMGLSGAFLTGDLFNLFVFFEVLLAASYALLLHGGGRARVGSTFHFLVINLTASGVFLIAVSLLYAVTGTLNMAHLSERIASASSADVALIVTAGILLLAVFATKAGLFPFHFWVPASYGSAAAPVVALIIAKIGAYVILRVYPLLFGGHLADGGQVLAPMADLAGPWTTGMALLTLVVGSAGALASRTLRQLAATLTLVSIGTLFVPIAAGTEQSIAASIFYLIHSTLATAALFLVAEWVGVQRGEVGDELVPGPVLRHPVMIGAALLWAAVNSVGLPPTPGFLGKVMVLASVGDSSLTIWLWLAVLASSFCALVAVARALSVLLWNTVAKETAEDGEHEYLVPPAQLGGLRTAGAVAATIAILVASVSMSIFAGPFRDEAGRVAAQMTDRDGYLDAVLGPAAGRTEAIRPSPAEAARRSAATAKGR